MTMNIDRTIRIKAKIFKALSDPIRLDILYFLRDGEKCVCEIIPHLKLIQPVVSRHLKILKDSGLVKDRKDGNRRMYSITNQKIFTVIDDVTPELIDAFTTRIFEQMT
ncbi:MAG: metalloregulator ArsR/SmtB family transcription factor [Candidatus Bathyarchaeota archaeon]|nr:metalloregulator ArsR/SmtB family transcription factor [Candidatus Bathyarchaeota archaeon]